MSSWTPETTGKAWNILDAVAESYPGPSTWVLLWYSRPCSPEFQWCEKLLACTALTQIIATSHLGLEQP